MSNGAANVYVVETGPGMIDGARKLFFGKNETELRDKNTLLKAQKKELLEKAQEAVTSMLAVSTQQQKTIALIANKLQEDINHIASAHLGV